MAAMTKEIILTYDSSNTLYGIFQMCHILLPHRAENALLSFLQYVEKYVGTMHLSNCWDGFQKRLLITPGPQR